MVRRQPALAAVVAVLVLLFALDVLVILAVILPLLHELRPAQAKNLQVDLRRQTRAVEQYVVRARTASSFRFARGPVRERIEAFARGQLSLEQFKLFAEQALRESVSQSTNISALYLIGQQTNVIVSLGKAIPQELWVVPDATSRDSVLKGPHLVEGEWCMVSGSPLLTAQGERIGSTMALYRLASLRATIEDYSELGETGETIVGDLSNKELPFFFPFRPQRESVTDDKRKLNGVHQALTSAQQGRNGMILPDESVAPSLVLAYGPVEGMSWGIVIKQDRDELFAPLNRRLTWIGGLTFGFLVLAAVGAALWVRPRKRIP